jgi:digeranylgeranylglycerophospholipid reductase
MLSRPLHAQGYARRLTVDQRSNVDVLVVGGGPAGLAAARAAATAGASVLLLERGRAIGRPVRTSGASWLRDVRKLGLPAELAQPIDRLRLIGPGPTAWWDAPRPLACVLDVAATYRHLAAQAERAGARLSLGEAVLAPLLDNGVVVGVATRGGDLRARVVVDASGVSRAVSSHPALRAVAATGPGVRLGQRFRRLGLGAEVELDAPYAERSTARLFVGRVLVPYGYGWAFPSPGGRLRVGAGVLHPPAGRGQRPAAVLARLLEQPALVHLLRGASVVEQHAGLLPAEPVGERYTAGLIVVGDAAAQAAPLLGEGIRQAIAAGERAGKAAAGAIGAGDTTAAGVRLADGMPPLGAALGTALGWWFNRRSTRYGDRNWRIVTRLLARLPPALLADGLRGELDPAWVLAAGPRLALGLGPALREAGRLKHSHRASVY